MNTSLVIRICVIALVILLLMMAWHALKGVDPGTQLLFFIVLGSIAGILGVKYIIPWIGDAVGTFIYSSGEEVQMDNTMKAAAKLAQGDYEGAIEEYQAMFHEDPERSFPVAEIAKIHAEKLNDPHKALTVLQHHLDARQWPEEDAAFLMFRQVDILADRLQDYDGAIARLEEIIGAFPSTRHSANAHHRKNELEQIQFKLAMEQRLKGGGAEA